VRKLQAITSPMFLAPMVVIYGTIHKYGHSMQDKLIPWRVSNYWQYYGVYEYSECLD